MKYNHRIVALALLSFLIFFLPQSTFPISIKSNLENKTGNFPNLTIQVEGQERAYRLFVPDSVKSQKNIPLVFAFHGLNDSKDFMPLYTKLNEAAQKYGFIIVYPNGIDKHWPVIPMRAGADLAFFDSLYQKITNDYPIDTNKVYLTGMSNGAYFINVVGQARSEKIAAIAPHSGSLGVLTRRGLKATHKYAVIIIHGDADKILSVSEGRRMRDAYKAVGYEVEYIEVPGLGHRWATSIDINDKIWQFFSSHPKK